MIAKIIDGKAIANKLKHTLKVATQQRVDAGKRRPGLAVIIIGSNPASQVYVSSKRRGCRDVGFRSDSYNLPEKTNEVALLELIDKLNADERIDGILVQLPLPKHINADVIIEHIIPHKDVDGFHPYNIGRLALRRPHIQPCTSKGIITLLQHTSVDLRGQEAIIVGASNIVGRPMALELLLTACTITVCHRMTRDLEAHVRRADILIVAVGRANFIPGHWIKNDSIIIDVGINRLKNGMLTGDIEYDVAKKKAAWITPVPGGVGPMTVVSLLENTFYAAKRLHEI